MGLSIAVLRFIWLFTQQQITVFRTCEKNVMCCETTQFARIKLV